VLIADDDLPPTISINDMMVSEDGGTINFTVSLSAISGLNTQVIYQTSNHTAISGSDYTAITASILTISAGFGTGTISVTITDDMIDESNEIFFINLSNPVNAYISDSQGTGTITDNDTPPSVTLSSSGSPFAENGGTATITATLSAQSGQDVTVNLGFTGTASSVSDYTVSGNAILISAGSTTGTITLTGSDDTLDESDETVIVNITSVTNGTESGTQQTTTVITDDDASPSVTMMLSSGTLSENGGISTVMFMLSAISGQNVTVNLGLTGTATSGTDYTASATSVMIAAGSNSGTITLTGTDDSLCESDETIIVDITSVTNGTESATQQVTAIITDDDVIPDVTLGLSGSPMAENGGIATVMITLSAVSGQNVTVNIGLTGTATSGSDYTASATSVVITAGSTSGALTLTGINDSQYEPGETIIVEITSVTNGTESGIQQVTAAITDDDFVPDVTLGLSGSPLAENGGTAAVTATLSAAATQNVTVNLGFAGTATGGGTDYTASGSSITISAGSTTGNITLTGNNDLLDEENETIIVDITGVTNGAESGTQQVTATITDDDAAPNLSFTAASQAIAENTGNATVTIQLSAASAKAVSIPFSVSGTASGSGTDYTLTPASPLIFDAGTTSRTISIAVNNDTLIEGDETIVITIGTPENATIGTIGTHTVTITDNDSSGWIINEIFADPGAADGDANGDDIIDVNQDEFIEIINNTGTDANISGWTLSDSTAVRHTFPSGTILRNQSAVLIFGGGTPSGTFGYARVQTASSGMLNLDDTGDTVLLTDSSSVVKAVYVYDINGGDDQSLVRSPDITGTTPLIKHSAATGSNGKIFSPGTKTDGTRFAGSNTPPATTPINNITVNEDAGNTSIAPGQFFNDDRDADTALSYMIANNTNTELFASAAISSGQLILDYADNKNGSANMTIRATDTEGAYSDITFSVTVTPVNDKPSFTASNLPEINEDAGVQTLGGWITGSPGPDDESEQTISYLIGSISNPDLFETKPAADSDGTLTYTPAANLFGTSTFMVIAQDDGGTENGGSDTSLLKTFTITVNSVDDPPIVKTPIEDMTIAEDSMSSKEIALNDLFTDADSDDTGIVKSISANNNPNLVSAVINDNTMTLTFAPNQSGIAYITILGTSGGKSAENTFGVTITPVNDAPVISVIQNQSTDDSKSPGPLAFTVNDTETGAENLTISGKSSDTNLVPDTSIILGGSGENRTLTVTPAENSSGTAEITVTVTDAEGASASSMFMLNITRGPDFITSTMNVSLYNDLDNDNLISPNDTLRYTITLTNTGDREATGVLFTGTLSETLLLVQDSVVIGNGNLSGTETFSIENITVPVNGSVVITFDATIITGWNIKEMISNQGTIFYDTTGDSINDSEQKTDGNSEVAGSQPTEILINSKPHILAVKTVNDLNGGEAEPGDILEYTVRLINQSGFNLNGMEYIADIPTYTICIQENFKGPSGGTVKSITPKIDITGIDIPANSEAKFSFQVQIKNTLSMDIKTLTCQGTLYYDSDGDETNDSEQKSQSSENQSESQPTDITVKGSPNFDDTFMDVGLYLDADLNGSVSPGDTLKYTVIISNTGNRDAVNVEFTDAVPSDATCFKDDILADAGTASYSKINNSIRWIGDIAAGDKITLIFYVRINSSVTSGDSIQNQGMVSYDSNNYGSNNAVEETDGNVEKPGNQFTEVSVFVGSVRPGDVNNDGDTDLKDAILVLKILSGIPVYEIYRGADVNQDGKIGYEELLYIIRNILK